MTAQLPLISQPVAPGRCVRCGLPSIATVTYPHKGNKPAVVIELCITHRSEPLR